MERTPEAYTRGILAAVLEPWIDGLSKVNTAYQVDRKLRGQLDNAAIEPAAKSALLDGILSTSAPDELRNFLNVLLANSDIGFLDEILALLNSTIREDIGGPKRAAVVSAIELSAEDQERVRTRLIEEFGANLEFTFDVNPELLGGMVVQVGDKLIDDSVRGRIDALRNTLGVRA